MDKTANEFEQQGESEPLFVHLTLIGVGGVPVDSVATQEYEPSAPTPPTSRAERRRLARLARPCQMNGHPEQAERLAGHGHQPTPCPRCGATPVFGTPVSKAPHSHL